MLENLDYDLRLAAGITIVFAYLFVATIFNATTQCIYEVWVNRVFLLVLAIVFAISPDAAIGTAAFFLLWLFFTAPFVLPPHEQGLVGRAHYAAVVRQIINTLRHT